ncbi:MULTISPECIES: DUF1307 domain-containing protein [unclassified Granulicatella]|uniref:DUF1307 domain-containing protein n=1 Tax=unclassified Granulicatella TaxID=2630493 RepID=UPI0010743E09|nr:MULTISPECIES: DUF1307 domain-containing protein [unclassified Granulicatella]MBF0780422.1 DUF1307 domain-containing protein [Granulicatella sp. 19428wC4_WM01]TFU95411.1 DUF1307 domain-containing protein [Granulicatella sp. WM01]
MKHIKKICIAFIVAIFLVACQSPEKKVTYKHSVKGGELLITFTAKDGLVTKQEIFAELKLSDLGITQKQAEQSIRPISKQYQSVKGITETLDITDTLIKEHVILDYTILDFKAAKNLPGFIMDDDITDASQLTLESVTEKLEKAGAVKQP